MEALRSEGPANSDRHPCSACCARGGLGEGPSAHGFEGERRTLARVWTLGRLRTLIRRHLRVSLSVATARGLLNRPGWSWQAPARRALERDERAVELWTKEARPRVKPRGVQGWIVLEDEAGFTMTSPVARTWGPARADRRHPRPRQVPPPDLGRRAVPLQTGEKSQPRRRGSSHAGLRRPWQPTPSRTPDPTRHRKPDRPPFRPRQPRRIQTVVATPHDHEGVGWFVVSGQLIGRCVRS
nr:winged helix-turn-helix domain-containing protein [Streptomyces sp. 3211]